MVCSPSICTQYVRAGISLPSSELKVHVDGIRLICASVSDEMTGRFLSSASALECPIEVRQHMRCRNVRLLHHLGAKGFLGEDLLGFLGIKDVCDCFLEAFRHPPLVGPVSIFGQSRHRALLQSHYHLRADKAMICVMFLKSQRF